MFNHEDQSHYDTGAKADNWMHMADTKLYNDNEYAISYLKEGAKNIAPQLPESETDTILFHCYWCGNVGSKQLFSIKSFLCTQDLSRSKVILWLDKYSGFNDWQLNPGLRNISKYIEVREYDPDVESDDTPWSSYKHIPNEPYNLAKRSDAFRYLILYKYGGIYFDLDMMFLRDIRNLSSLEFCYAWENQSYANSAICHLEKRSIIATYLMHKSIKAGSVLPWIILNYADLELKKMTVYPCAFFDPVWQGLEGEHHLTEFDQFFDDYKYSSLQSKTISYKDFFTGCFTYHWHNRWHVTEHHNSFFRMFENEFNQILML